jgi:predicted nuclease of restriction endonuclease-like RecB superfamily
MAPLVVWICGEIRSFPSAAPPPVRQRVEELIFPDFALQLRSDPGQRWLLEIAGFWTPDDVSRKLAL